MNDRDGLPVEAVIGLVGMAVLALIIVWVIGIGIYEGKFW